MRRALLTFIGSCAFAASMWSPACALESAAHAIAIPLAASAPPIDGTYSPEAWKGAVTVPLVYDGKKHVAATETTLVHLLADRSYLYVAFEATQMQSPILTAQRTNNVGVDLDDEVKVALWPNATQGFAYQFIATPIGTRYQYSTENDNYEPRWDAMGRVDGSHYTVTMRIPLSVMRSQSANNWYLQLTRWESKTDSLFMANGGANVQGTGDFNYAIPIAGITPVVTRPQARVAAYTLGAISAPSAGGATSRAGADLSVPLTAGTSLIATVHPDFSNVEQDQQSISPSAFARYYSETRPFFAQGAHFYNYMECDACPNEMSLYTPSIPTPRTGYAIEGQEGRFSFAGFDAVGVGRIDQAQSVTFRTRPRTFYVSTQRVAVDLPGLHDVTTQLTSKWDDQQHRFVYANYGVDRGTNVTDPRQGVWYELGGGYYTAQSFTGGGIRKIGAQYSPYDGFVSYTDLAGYGFFHQHTLRPRGGLFKSINYSGEIDRYHGAVGLDYTDNNANIDVVTRSLWEFSTGTGSSYAYIGNVFTPLTQEQTTLTYHSGTSTPTTLGYAIGHFGDGLLTTWTRITNLRTGPRSILTLELDDTRQRLNTGGVNVQWLERASLAYQVSPESSFAVGLRRFQGTPPTPSGYGCYGICSNVSFAYHQKIAKRELYVAYGNPGTLYTTPQFLVKLIDYIGADKGT